MDRGADRLGSTLRRLGGALAAFIGIRQVARLADEMLALQNRLRIVTGSTQELARVQSELFTIANRTRQPISAIAQLYTRGSIAAQELGVSQEELLLFTERVGQALAIQGTSAAQSAGALLQLSQALGSGIVRAEEFNSILEGAFPIAQAAARGLDRASGSVARLRGLVIEGEVSSREFFEAFIEGSSQTAEQFEKTRSTIGGGLNELNNRLLELVADIDTSTGVFGLFADSIRAVARELRTILSVLTGLLTVPAISLAVRGLASAFSLLAAAVRAHPILAIGSAIGGLIGLFEGLSASVDDSADAVDRFITVTQGLEGSLERINRIRAEQQRAFEVGDPQELRRALRAEIDALEEASVALRAQAPGAPTRIQEIERLIGESFSRSAINRLRRNPDRQAALIQEIERAIQERRAQLEGRTPSLFFDLIRDRTIQRFPGSQEGGDGSRGLPLFDPALGIGVSVDVAREAGRQVATIRRFASELDRVAELSGLAADQQAIRIEQFELEDRLGRRLNESERELVAARVETILANERAARTSLELASGITDGLRAALRAESFADFGRAFLDRLNAALFEALVFRPFEEFAQQLIFSITSGLGGGIAASSSPTISTGSAPNTPLSSPTVANVNININGPTTQETAAQVRLSGRQAAEEVSRRLRQRGSP